MALKYGSKFTVVLDAGKPYEKRVSGRRGLKKVLKDFYLENKNNEHHFDVHVYDEKGDDVTEGMVVQTLIGEILEEV